LEIVGRKVDPKYEKKLDVNYKKIQATKFAQRVYRGYRARQRVIMIRRTLAAIVVQKYARRRAAVKLKKHLKLQKCVIMVQN